MADVVDEIKGRLGIVDLVSQYVQLKKAGRNFKGLCPFHSEKTPSFVVSPEKQICHCFGCNNGGDIFTFIQEVEGITFVEAIQVLADKVGVKVEKRHMKSGGAKKTEKDEFFKAHELACAFYEEKLFHSKAGEKVLNYLQGRGLKEETIREFRLGFAPDDYNVLHNYLLKKGVRKDILIKSGFVTSKNLASDSIYDKFRARLMFPIFDYLGRICGFGGRALKKEQMPKYLNSPENLIYNKSNILYGLSHAKQSVKEENHLILVEGYFDVILPYQEGIKNIAATSGTALTVLQVTKIKRISSSVLTCFDADDAGFEATKRAYVLLNEKDITVRTTADFQGKDPADFVKEDPEAFKIKLKDADDFIKFYMNELIKRHDISRFQGRKKILSELLPLYKKMSAATKDYYVRDLAQKLNVPERTLYDEIDTFILPDNHPAKLDSEFIPEQNLDSISKLRIDQLIIAIFLYKSQIFKNFVEKINEKYFKDDVNTIYKELTNQYN
ncbi:DNA primase, partial [Patescibacteria group bacterium]